MTSQKRPHGSTAPGSRLRTSSAAALRKRAVSALTNPIPLSLPLHAHNSFDATTMTAFQTAAPRGLRRWWRAEMAIPDGSFGAPALSRRRSLRQPVTAPAGAGCLLSTFANSGAVNTQSWAPRTAGTSEQSNPEGRGNDVTAEPMSSPHASSDCRDRLTRPPRAHGPGLRDYEHRSCWQGTVIAERQSPPDQGCQPFGGCGSPP